MPTPSHTRTCGFRFWPTDALFIGACALACYLLEDALAEMVWLIPVAAGHFFLFCNLFRVRRRYELIWAGIFLVNFGAWTWSGSFSWWGVLGLQAPVTIAAIVAEMRSRRYHGVWCRRINPGHIDEWLKGGMSGAGRATDR